jgi:hypothetical protein
MLMVIFGAGASWDSVPEAHWNATQKASAHDVRPPMAQDLFSNRGPLTDALSGLPRALGIVGELRLAAGAVSIEEVLQRLVGEAEAGDSVVAQQLLAVRFLLSRLIQNTSDPWHSLASGITNYGTLVSKLDRFRRRNDGRVLVVTFNYDLMLEHALSSELGWSLNEIDDYVAREPWWVVKPHGSVNWIRPVVAGNDGQTEPKHLISLADKIEESEDPFLVNEAPPGIATVPALAVPTVSKATWQCPASHLEALRDLLRQVDTIVITGWKGAERNFLDLCRQIASGGSVLRRCVVANGTEEAGNDTIRNVSPYLRNYHFDAYDGGFSRLAGDDTLLESIW